MHLHILGICGTFMGGLAALAREAGHTVTGCDAGVYPPMSDQLRALGIELIEGFDASQMALKPDVFVVGNVVSRARKPDGTPKFPLMEAILDAGAPYTSGPQWLAEHVLQGRHVLGGGDGGQRVELVVHPAERPVHGGHPQPALQHVEVAGSALGGEVAHRTAEAAHLAPATGVQHACQAFFEPVDDHAPG